MAVRQCQIDVVNNHALGKRTQDPFRNEPFPDDFIGPVTGRPVTDNADLYK